MSALRQTLRRFSRSPGFALAIVVTIALGTGVNATIFSMVESILLRPLPFHAPDRLVRLRGTVPERGVVPWISPLDLQDIRDLDGVFADVGGVKTDALTVVGMENAAARVGTAFVTPGFLPALDVGPVAGRSFVETDFRGVPAVALISEAAARRRFGDLTRALGAGLSVEGQPITIVGVLPDRADLFGNGSELWLPLVTDEGRGSRSLIAIARLAGGVTVDESSAALDVLAKRLARAYPESNEERGLVVTPLQESIVADHRKLLVMLQLAALAVLLVASANAGAIAFTRFASRRRELAVRGSLGASRARIVRSLLAELSILGIVGGLMGLGIGMAATRAIVAWSPFDLPRRADVRIDPTVVVVMIGVAIAAALLAGIGPALRLTRRGASLVLREGGGAIGIGRERHLNREIAVAVTIAISVALVGSATSLGRSLGKLLATDTGFSRQRIATFDVRLPESGWEEAARREDYYARMLVRLASLPGVDHAGAISMIPFGGENLCADVAIVGAPRQPDCSELRFVSRDLFATLGIALVAGRGFDRNDTRDSRPVAIVNRAFAERFSRVAIGRELEWNDRRWTIVGIVGDVRVRGFDEDSGQQIYLSMEQVTPPFMAFAIRSTPGSEVSLATLRREAETVDAGVVVDEFATVDRLLSRSVAAPRFRSAVVGAIAALALALTMIGLYGALAVLVRDRTREIALRVALGATAADVRRLVLFRGGRIAAYGITAGFALLAGANRLIQNWLFDVSAIDPGTVVVTVALILTAVALACLAPVHRAVRVDPALALKGLE